LTGSGVVGTGGLTYFQDSGGNDRLLILANSGRAFVSDLYSETRDADGLLLGEFNTRVKLGLINRADITAITTGPLAGAFAIVDRNGSELVIFRLD
jgi:hypothetical protein